MRAEPERGYAPISTKREARLSRSQIQQFVDGTTPTPLRFATLTSEYVASIAAGRGRGARRWHGTSRRGCIVIRRCGRRDPSSVLPTSHFEGLSFLKSVAAVATFARAVSAHGGQRQP